MEAGQFWSKIWVEKEEIKSWKKQISTRGKREITEEIRTAKLR